MVRIAVGGFHHETNTFAATPATYDDFVMADGWPGLTRGDDGTSLESILGSHLERVYSLNRDVDELTTRTADLARIQRKAFQKIGLVRFNPFEDTGGNQSFALALLDEDKDGFIVSSLHSRNGTRIYAKAITAGRCDTAMSSEEEEALKIALASGAGAAKA